MTVSVNGSGKRSIELNVDRCVFRDSD